MLRKILISAFRGLENQCFDFGNKTHIIGLNGSGKTHILDAIHLLAGAKNLYGNTRLEHHDRIEVLFWDDITAKSYILSADERREIYMAHGKKLSRPKYLEALPFRTVYVSPFDMNILYFAPSMRRDYLDDILSRAYAQFGKIRRDYEGVMRQRNALLKKIREGEASRDGLDFWDGKFAEIATLYGMYRSRYIGYVREKIWELPVFFGAYHIEISYDGEWLASDNPEEYIRTYLRANRERDILSGHTHIGPHRDDFMLSLLMEWGERQSVQFFLSRGEMKMLLLGLKVIESDFMAKQTDTSVILLVDDIFAELDEKNIILFLNNIIQHQMILTSQKPLPEGINSWYFTCINLTNP